MIQEILIKFQFVCKNLEKLKFEKLKKNGVEISYSKPATVATYIPAGCSKYGVLFSYIRESASESGDLATVFFLFLDLAVEGE